MRQKVAAAILSLIVSATIGCRAIPWDRALITYSVIGTAASVFVAYLDPLEGIVKSSSVSPPWSLEFTLHRSFDAYLLAYNETGAGSITAAILVDGIAAAEKTSAAPNGLVSMGATVVVED